MRSYLLVVMTLVFGSGCLFYSGLSLADDAPLPPGHGFMLIRINLEQPEKIGLLSMSNVDTNSMITIRSSSFKQVGIYSWIALMAMPHGHYFWSEFQSKHGAGGLPTATSVQTFTQRAPDSANKIIEIVPGAVNYVGDWELRISSLASPRAMKLNRRIEFAKSTLEQYVAEYPEYANKYEIYVSKTGEKAISLNEPANQENEQPSDEPAKPTKIHPDEIVDTVVTTSPEVSTRERSAPRIDLYEELLKLDELRNMGLLTDAEFEEEKKKLLEKN